MLLDIPKLRNGDQDEKSLSGLLKDLSIKESKDEISDLEYNLANVSLNKEDVDDKNQKNEDVSEESDDEQSSKDKATGKVDDKQSEKVDEETQDETKEEKLIESKTDKADEAVSVKETEKEESTKESEDEQDPEVNQNEEKESTEEKELLPEEKEEKESTKDSEKDESSTKSSEDEEETKDEGSEKSTSPKVTPPVKEKKLLARGFGAGTSEQQFSPFIYDHSGYNFSCGSSPEAPMPYSPNGQMFQAMSPQHAASPTYLGMALSPVPGYTDSNASSPLQNCNGFYDSGMTMDSMMGMNTYILPESPSLLLDENEQTPHPNMISNYEHTTDEVLEAIARVENNSQTSVDPNKVDDIKKTLLQNIGSQEESVSMYTDVNADYPNTNAPRMDNFQSWMIDNMFSGLPSPPAEDLNDGSARQEILLKIPNLPLLEKTQMNVSAKTNEFMTQKDKDGDHPFMVVACQQEGSEKFYRDFYAVACRVKDIKICCEEAVSISSKACRVCGNTDATKFYSPLAMHNNEGDTVLRSVIRAGQSELVVKFLCEFIYQNPSDVDRIFCQQNIDFYRSFVTRYPVLQCFLQGM